MNITSHHVKRIQQALRDIGLYYQHPDGIWNAFTTEGIQQYHAHVLHTEQANQIWQPRNLSDIPACLLKLAGLDAEVDAEAPSDQSTDGTTAVDEDMIKAAGLAFAASAQTDEAGQLLDPADVQPFDVADVPETGVLKAGDSIDNMPSADDLTNEDTKVVPDGEDAEDQENEESEEKSEPGDEAEEEDNSGASKGTKRVSRPNRVKRMNK